MPGWLDGRRQMNIISSRRLLARFVLRLSGAGGARDQHAIDARRIGL
jgi:hypothetical protein